MGLQQYNQDMSKILIKYNINVLFTQSIHTLRLSVGGRTDGRTHERTDGRTDGHTDGWTDGQTENIYSIFRDKLLLLGEHVLVLWLISKGSQCPSHPNPNLINVTSTYFSIGKFVPGRFCRGADATTGNLRWSTRLSGAVDRFCHLIGPNRARIDFGGGDLVSGVADEE